MPHRLGLGAEAHVVAVPAARHGRSVVVDDFSDMLAFEVGVVLPESCLQLGAVGDVVLGLPSAAEAVAPAPLPYHDLTTPFADDVVEMLVRASAVDLRPDLQAPLSVTGAPLCAAFDLQARGLLILRPETTAPAVA